MSLNVSCTRVAPPGSKRAREFGVTLLRDTFGPSVPERVTPGERGHLGVEPVSGFEPLTCRLQDGCSAN